MRELLLILRLLSLVPPIGPRPQDPARLAVAGTATLVISSCKPGDTITVGPGNYRAFVPEDGTVVLKVPAQADEDDPYQLQDHRGTRPLHGTAAAGQMLSGACI